MSDDGGCFDGHLGGQPGGRRVLPAGFADLPAGPGLAAAVASVDVAGCNGFELEELIKGLRRLGCWVEAECLTAVNELVYAEPGRVDGPAGRSVTPDPMTPEVLEPLLGWTGYRAHQYVALAATLPRLPRVREALASGGLELNDVRVIVDRITDAEPDVWGAIEEAIFPKVLELRGGLLRAKVEAEVVTADPEAAAKRHRAARSGRNVAIWPAVDGVADLAIRGLSAGQAAEAYGYIDAIARAVKSSGDPRTLSQLRADVAAALLTGTADIKDCSAPAATNHTRQDQAAQGAVQKQTKKGEAEQHQAEQDEAEQDEAGQDAAGQDAAGQDETPRDTGQCTAEGDAWQERGEQGPVRFTGSPTTTCTAPDVTAVTALPPEPERLTTPPATAPPRTTPQHTTPQSATRQRMPRTQPRVRSRGRTADPTKRPTRQVRLIHRQATRHHQHHPGPPHNRAGGPYARAGEDTAEHPPDHPDGTQQPAW
ncbi:hypothetical protein [Actinopolymorpha singaporensis]|uniref:DUF222 domain-containing protein n=1 Tax=Actinopolymorpha singaporensis TaxID=117157 RepID=A0A1H1PXS6_9ACTN|nr:hypothetical protein [Actinopolymorpha singaporensis]SDS15960.1 hypothetical protein SAMN04489717_1806 [Actinopolymorpha singaporensis]